MPKFTKQETFNLVVKGLAAQGFEQAKGPYESSDCMYRDDKGRKCAAGQLIPDEIYDPEMEAMGSIRWLSIHNPLYHWYADSGLADHDEGLLIDLQTAHDGATGPMQVKIRLRQVAHDHELTTPPELAA